GAGTRSSAPGTAHKFAALGTASLFSFGAAFRLSSLRYDLLRLIRANQTLCQERFGRLRDRGDVLAMIFPRPARRWTVAWRDLLDAAPVCVHDGAGNSARAQIQRVRNSILVGIRFAGERERGIERSLAGDVRSDAQPIWRQRVIANPALQIGRERKAGGDNRPGRGQPQKVAAVQAHFRPEEIM